MDVDIPFIGVLNCIPHEVHEDLLDPQRVRVDHLRHIIIDLQLKFEILHLGLNLKDLDDALGVRPDVEGLILELEGVEYDKKVVAEVVKKYFPDNRRVINELQRYSARGKIDSGILSNIGDVSISELVKSLKDKAFTDMRKWVATNVHNDVNVIFRKIYDDASNFIEPSSIPQLVTIVADYQYKSAFVVDQEINLVACLTEIMVECQFKS